jgi:RHS repeat-associated protein
MLAPVHVIAGQCSTGTYSRLYFGHNDEICGACGNDHQCWIWEQVDCATGAVTDATDGCITSISGAGPNCVDTPWICHPYDDSDTCGPTTDACDTPVDDNHDGCVNEGCTFGRGICTCTARCAAPSCAAPPEATCNVYGGEVRETCGNRVDDNCNGPINEGCPPPTYECDGCGGLTFVGFDPISLVTRGAATEPFTDFSVETVVKLDFTRIYTSADASLQGGPVGPLGTGWHHDWEATLSCDGDYCTVGRGMRQAYGYNRNGAALSTDGLETWDVYTKDESFGPVDDANVLIRRPSGEWILFDTDGSEIHLASVCDSCGAAEATCLDPRSGGVARATAFVDARGAWTHVSYDRPTGLIVGISDDLGHALELRSANACTEGLARELRFDGDVVATYSYEGLDLARVVDADGSVLRAYVYQSPGVLRAILDESGSAVVEFSYDESGSAVGVIDRRSDVTVSYGENGLADVTERYSGTSSTSQRQLNADGKVTWTSYGSTSQYVDNRLVCATGATGKVTYRSYDALGRVTYTAEYRTDDRLTCPPDVALPADSREEWTEYGLVKPIAQGVSVPLDRVAVTKHRSKLQAAAYESEAVDFDPTPNAAIDPAGYFCTEAPLPVGAVPCRRIASGYTRTADGTTVLERHATFYSYDTRGRLVRTVGPINLDRPSASDITPVEERTYWPDTETMPRRGRLHEVKRYAAPDAAPLTTSIDYDAFGPYTITEPNGATTMFVKDGRGRARFTLRAGGTWETRYHDGTNPRLQLSPSGAAVRTSYDGRGRPAKIEYLDRDPDVSGAVPVVAWSEHTVYDSAGNAVHVERRDAAGAVAWKQDRDYDAQHRVIGEPHPESAGASRRWTYDAAGFLRELLDEEQRKTAFTPDGLARVLAIEQSGVDASGIPVAAKVAGYGFQPGQDVLASVSDGKGQRTLYVYDDFGRLSELSSDTLRIRPVRFSYDARGNLLWRGTQYATVDYTYDGLDRMRTAVARDLWDNRRIDYEYRYDEGGRPGQLTSIVEPDRIVRFDYDTGGHLARETVEENGIPEPGVTEYAYDVDGNLDTTTYPSGLKVKLEHDNATGGVRKVRTDDGTTTFAERVEWWPGGPARFFAFGNGQTFSQTVTLRYEPRTIRSGPLSLDYTMTPAGDVGAVQDGATAYQYGYDYRDRLVGMRPGFEAGQDLVHHYVFDRLEESGTPTASGFVKRWVYDYDLQTNVSAVTAYAADGTATASVCLRHAALGRLVLVGKGPKAIGDRTACVRDDDVTEPIARFRYDARGRRVARWLAATGEWTYFAFTPSGELLSEQTLASGSALPWRPVRDYVWLGGRPLAQMEHLVAAQPRVYVYHVDHLGLPRYLSSPEGATVWTSTLRPYGDVEETTVADPATGATVVTNLRLPGQYDERLFAAAGISGLQGPYYNNNRWYLPSVGRYLELDPIALRGGMNGPHGPDWYNYAEGNPLTKTDFFGLDAEACKRDMYGLMFLAPGQHCFVRFNGDDKDTSSFDPGGVHPDPAPPWWPGRQCKPTNGPQDDDCMKKEMKKCKNYDFFGFNCCHCVEQAMKKCGLSVPPEWWPNWPINPGPQPFEPGYSPTPK